MDVDSLYPRVMSWMKEARGSHPLSELIGSVRDGGSSPGSAAAILAAFEQVIAGLEAARPERLLTERADFRKARSWDDLLIVRAELVAGHKLAQAGVPFDFGVRGGSPQPDLVLRETELGIEVKARRLDGLRDLHDELEEALENAGAEVVVHIACRERPLYLKEAERRDLVSEAWTGLRAAPTERYRSNWISRGLPLLNFPSPCGYFRMIPSSPGGEFSSRAAKRLQGTLPILNLR